MQDRDKPPAGTTVDLSRRRALARLGVAVGAVYAAPVLMQLSQSVAASGPGSSPSPVSVASAPSDPSPVSVASAPSDPSEVSVASAPSDPSAVSTPSSPSDAEQG